MSRFQSNAITKYTKIPLTLKYMDCVHFFDDSCSVVHKKVAIHREGPSFLEL